MNKILKSFEIDLKHPDWEKIAYKNIFNYH